MQNLKVFHGGRRWLGWPEITPSKRGRGEYGPGVYCTTGLRTALKYAKTGGNIVRIELKRDIKWLEDIKVDFNQLLDEIKNSNIRKKKILIKDLQKTYGKKDQELFKGQIFLSFFVNLAVNNDCVSGKSSLEIAQMLVNYGAQASLCRKTNRENWVVIFDPKAVKNYEILSSKNIDWDHDELPTIDEQIIQS